MVLFLLLMSLLIFQKKKQYLMLLNRLKNYRVFEKKSSHGSGNRIRGLKVHHFSILWRFFSLFITGRLSLYFFWNLAGLLNEEILD